MTNRKWLYLIIGAPLALGLSLALVVGITDGPEIATQVGISSLAGALLVLGGSHLLMWFITHRGYAAFRYIARRQGGIVVSNWMGEKQLRIPLHYSTIIVEYRAYGSPDGGSEFWTRVGLELPGKTLPRGAWQIDESGEVLGKFPTEAAKKTVNALGIKNLKMKVKIDQEQTTSIASIWVPTYLQEVEVIENLLTHSIPGLQELVATNLEVFTQ